MTQERFKGYRGPGLAVLQQHNVGVWSDVEIESARGRFRGLILPRSETASDRQIVLKLDSGYNIGVAADTITRIVEHGRREAHYKIPEQDFPSDPAKPNVLLLGTGGTIASRLDYRTGAVIPAFSPGELYGSVPELADICNLKTEKLFAVFSENMGPTQYIALAKRIGQAIEQGVDGIVIGHGTDTMHHTAAALTFMVQNPPVPIVMVGSQRSSDRPSSDAAMNLICAVKAAASSDIAEVQVCMFGPTSDEYCLLHRGTRVRKMHSSYRSTFRTIGDIPLAMIDPQKITPLRSDYRRRAPARKPESERSAGRDPERGSASTPQRSAADAPAHRHTATPGQRHGVSAATRIIPTFEERVAIVYYYPNMHPDIIDALVEKGYRGIVIAGTGLGHVNKPLYPAIKRAHEAGVHLYMTVQTLWGYVHMYVYETGRELMALGIVPAANMLPEVAYIKLAWALGQVGNLRPGSPEEHAAVEKLMLTPIADEITDREPYNGYLVYQGGIPEVQEFLREIRR